AGDLSAMRAAAGRLGRVPTPYLWSRGEPLAARDGLAILQLGELSRSASRAGRPTVEGGDAAYRYVVEAARMTMAGDASAMITAPISKEWMHRAGHRFPGHSELLARVSGTTIWRMMFAGRGGSASMRAAQFRPTPHSSA